MPIIFAHKNVDDDEISPEIIEARVLLGKEFGKHT
jgi:hypothetical protein